MREGAHRRLHGRNDIIHSGLVHVVHLVHRRTLPTREAAAKALRQRSRLHRHVGGVLLRNDKSILFFAAVVLRMTGCTRPHLESPLIAARNDKTRVVSVAHVPKHFLRHEGHLGVTESTLLHDHVTCDLLLAGSGCRHRDAQLRLTISANPSRPPILDYFTRGASFVLYMYTAR